MSVYASACLVFKIGCIETFRGAFEGFVVWCESVNTRTVNYVWAVECTSDYIKNLHEMQTCFQSAHLIGKFLIHKSSVANQIP